MALGEGPSPNVRGGEKPEWRHKEDESRREEEWPISPPMAIWPVMRGGPLLREKVPLTPRPFFLSAPCPFSLYYPSLQEASVAATLFYSSMFWFQVWMFSFSFYLNYILPHAEGYF